jgi:hypothetical protein
MSYVLTCMKDRNQLGCDPVRVIEYNEIMQRYKAGDQPQFFPAFTEALTTQQIDEGKKLAQAVKPPVKTPDVPVEWFARPILPN